MLQALSSVTPCVVSSARMMGWAMMAVHLEGGTAEHAFIQTRGQHILRSGGPPSGRKYDVRLSKRRAFRQVICRKVDYCFRIDKLMPLSSDSVMHGNLYTLNYSCYLVSPFPSVRLCTHTTHLDGSVTGRSVLAVALVRPVGLWLNLLNACGQDTVSHVYTLDHTRTCPWQGC